MLPNKKQPERDERKKKKMITLYDETIKEIKGRVDHTFADSIVDYDDGYICDIISEIADNNIDIYTYDLLDWLRYNYDVVEDANREFGTSDDIIKQCQQGQYYKYTNDLYDVMDDMILLFAYNYLRVNDIEFDAEQLEELESELSTIDNNDKLEDITDKIEEIKGE